MSINIYKDRMQVAYLHPLRPASPEEAGLFYALPPEKDEELGAIGHVRIDFGRDGTEFWHTWWPRGPEELNTQAFREELGEVVNDLRKGVLKDLPSMIRYCSGSGGAIEGGSCCQNYGFTLETERYIYRLRCNPIRGDYNSYLACFDKQAQKQTFDLTPPGQGVDGVCGITEKEAVWQPLAVKNLAGLKRAIKPGVELMATRHALHPDLVGLVRVVGIVQTNGFYSTIKDQPDHRWSVCNSGKGVWTPFEKADRYIFDGHSFKVLDKHGGESQVLYEVEIRDMKMCMDDPVPDGYEGEKAAPPVQGVEMGGMSLG